MANIQNYVGMTEDAAIKAIEKDGFRARVVAKDGEHYIVTADYRLDRVNLTIKEGKVTSADIG